MKVLAEMKARPDRRHVAGGDVAASDDHSVLAVEARRREVVVQRRHLEAGQRTEPITSPNAPSTPPCALSTGHGVLYARLRFTPCLLAISSPLDSITGSVRAATQPPVAVVWSPRRRQLCASVCILYSVSNSSRADRQLQYARA
eukprot:scaffold424_cov69-Phaeocystis_antarctica.AAC.10